MANIDVAGEVEGILSPQESVEKMLAVIPTKTMQDTGTFWTWEGKVRYPVLLHSDLGLDSPRKTRSPYSELSTHMSIASLR